MEQNIIEAAKLSMKYLLTFAQLNHVLEMKATAVKNQEFEAASQFRGVENKLRQDLPTISQIESVLKTLENEGVN